MKTSEHTTTFSWNMKVSFEVSKMPMNELQKKCLEFLKLFRKKSIANELIEQTCYMLMTLPRDKKAEQLISFLNIWSRIQQIESIVQK